MVLFDATVKGFFDQGVELAHEALRFVVVFIEGVVVDLFYSGGVDEAHVQAPEQGIEFERFGKHVMGAVVVAGGEFFGAHFHEPV